MKQTHALLVLFSLGFFFPAFSQSWTKVQHWGGIGTEICSGLVPGRDGSLILAGSFEKQILFGNHLLTAVGAEDIFICKWQPDQEIAWARQISSQLTDQLTAMDLDANDHLVVTGSYWQEADFGGIKLTAAEHSKAIFMAKYTPEGTVLWAKSLNGNGLKEASAVVCDKQNNILLTGYFEKNLQIGDTLLSARGTTDFFLAKFSSAGRLLWVVQQGKTGDTRSTALGVVSNGDAVVAGFFNDSTQIADTMLIANTQDQDLFLAKFDKNGVPLWAKKAGGVFDSDVTALALDTADNIFVTGYFVGVLRLSAGLQLQSGTGNPDFFILKYQSDGTPATARAWGGRQLDQALDLHWQNNILHLSGIYQGEMTLDGFSVSTGNSLSGFVAGFDENLQPQWLKNLASDATLYASQIAVTTQGAVLIGGSFNGEATLGPFTIQANTFDLLLATLQFPTTATAQSEGQILFRVFPNPSAGQVFIQTQVNDYTVQVTNSTGQIVFSGKQLPTLDFSQLPKGAYFITFQGDFIKQTFKIFWN